MPTAKKLPSGSWRCQVFSHYEEIRQPDGTIKKKRIYKSFTSDNPLKAGKKEAELMAAQYAAEKKLPSSGSTVSFSEALESCIELKEPVLSPSTIRAYKNIGRMLNEKYPGFCSKRICDIEQNDIQRVIDGVAKERSPKTVRNYHGLITAVLTSNGSSLNVNTTLPQKVPASLYIPSDSDIQRLIDAVRETELEIPVLLGAFCTMRRGEICALSLKDIKGNTIHIHQSMVLGLDKQWHLKPPKTVSSDRYIEAPDFVIQRIQQIGHITNLTPHSLTIMFGRVLERNNIPHFRFHDLRHYSASVKHALGIPDAYIMADGGWCSDGVLKNVYRHAMNDRRKEMTQKANEHFSTLCNTKYNTKTKNP